MFATIIFTACLSFHLDVYSFKKEYSVVLNKINLESIKSSFYTKLSLSNGMNNKKGKPTGTWS